MRLSEDQNIVLCLDQILEDYDYLEQDKKRPKRDAEFKGLHIKLTAPAQRNIQVIEDIRNRLKQATSRNYFFTYGGSYSGAVNFGEVWTYFTLRESDSVTENEMLRTARIIDTAFDRIFCERELETVMDFEITLSHTLTLKFFNYSGSTSSLLYIATDTIRSLNLVEKFPTVFYGKTRDVIEVELSSL